MLKKKIPLIPERNTLAIPDSRKTLIIPERKILDMLEKDSTALQWPTVWLLILILYFLPCFTHAIITNNISICHQHQQNNQPGNTALHAWQCKRERLWQYQRERLQQYQRERLQQCWRKTLQNCNDWPFDGQCHIQQQHFWMPTNTDTTTNLATLHYMAMPETKTLAILERKTLAMVVKDFPHCNDNHLIVNF